MPYQTILYYPIRCHTILRFAMLFCTSLHQAMPQTILYFHNPRQTKAQRQNRIPRRTAIQILMRIQNPPTTPSNPHCVLLTPPAQTPDTSHKPLPPPAAHAPPGCPGTSSGKQLLFWNSSGQPTQIPRVEHESLPQGQPVRHPHRCPVCPPQ